MYVCIMICMWCTVAAVLDDQPYCTLRYRRLCQGKGPHVACEFSQPGSGPYCYNYTRIEFTKVLRDFIVNDINRRRQRAAAGRERVHGGVLLPRSEIMMLVSWDRELGYLAQRLADQCQFIHDDCRATVRYPYAGQSVGEVRFRESKTHEVKSIQRAVRRVLDAWWGERRRVRPSQLTAPLQLPAKGLIWGHFSQLVVWTLRAVGCGAVIHGRTFTRLLIVCDFSHTNMIGQRTIKPGPNTPCPAHTQRRLRARYPLLCAPFKHSNIDVNMEDIEEEEDDTDDIIPGDENDERSETITRDYVLNIQNETPARDFFKWTTTTLQGDNYVKAKKILLKASGGTKKYYLWETFSTEDAGETEALRDNYETTASVNSSESRDDAQTDIRSFRVRPKWKQTRVRLNRPGANALLKTIRTDANQRSSIGGLFVDKDVLDQVFQDTGFNASWRRQQKPLQN